MFTQFTECQKELFWEVIKELPQNFNDAKAEDIEYLVDRIERGKAFNKRQREILCHSTLLLRLLKEIAIWKNDTNQEEGENEEFDNKRKELLELLKRADIKKKNQEN